MNHRQRVIAAIRHEATDRPPRYLWLGAGAKSNLMGELGLSSSAVDDLINNDVLQTWLSINRQMSLEKPQGQVFVDEWGITWKREGPYNSVVAHPLADMDADGMRLHGFPDPMKASRYSELRRLVLRSGSEHFIGADVSGTLFEPACHLRSMETFLMDLADENEEAAVLLDRLEDFSTKVACEAVRLGADWIWLGDDMGSQQAMLIPPDLWRRSFKPRMKRIIERIRRARPGMTIAYHSCGSISPILGDIAEIGVDVINPLQESAGLDQNAVKKALGETMTLMCGLDTQSFLITASYDETYDAMTGKIRSLGTGGGYIAAVSHTLQHDVPVRNMVAILDALDGKRREASWTSISSKA